MSVINVIDSATSSLADTPPPMTFSLTLTKVEELREAIAGRTGLKLDSFKLNAGGSILEDSAPLADIIADLEQALS